MRETKTKKVVKIVEPVVSEEKVDIETDGTDEIVKPVAPIKKKRAYVRKTKPKPLSDSDETN